MRADELPALAAIVRGPKRAGGRAHGKLLAGLVYIEPVPVNEVIGVALRQPLAHDLPRLAAIFGFRHAKRAIARHTDLILDRRHEPRGLAVARVRHDRKTEIVAGQRQPRPVSASIGRTIDTGMVLHPYDVRRRGAARDPMRVLNRGVLGLFGRHIRRDETLAKDGPGRAIVAALPYSPAGNGDTYAIRIARVRRHAVNSSSVIAATEPARALGNIPKRSGELPALAAVVGPEQTRGNCADPQPIRMMASAC